MIRIKRLIYEARAVLEVLDARDLAGTRIPIIEKMSGSKKLFLIINKMDLLSEADKEKINKMKLPKNFKITAKSLSNAEREEIIAQIKKHAMVLPARVLLVGYPNVGKSTFINSLSKRKAAKVSDVAGTTTNVQFVNVDPDLTLVDYKGLHPRFEKRSELIKKHAINTNESPLIHAYNFLERVMKSETLAKWIEQKYDIKITSKDDPATILEKIAKRRGYLIKGGEANTDLAARNLLKARFEAPEL